MTLWPVIYICRIYGKIQTMREDKICAECADKPEEEESND